MTDAEETTEVIVKTANRLSVLAVLGFGLGVVLFIVIQNELEIRRALKDARERLAGLETKMPANHTENGRVPHGETVAEETMRQVP